MPSHPCLVRPCRLFLTLLPVLVLGPALPSRAADEAQLRFPMTRTVAEIGITRVIHFRAATPPSRDRVFPSAVSPRDTLEIVAPPSLLAGQTLGTVRVRGLRPGSVALNVGDAVLGIDVIPPRVGEAFARQRPRLVGPVTGAVVWGEIGVGAECDATELPPGCEIVLALPDGTVQRSSRAFSAVRGNALRGTFSVDTARLPVGPQTLVARLRAPDGRETAGDPVHVRIVRARAEALTLYEAEEPPDVPRPEAFGPDRPGVGIDPGASGEQFVFQWGGEPPPVFAVDVPGGGWYQVSLRVRGTPGGGAFPSVAFFVDPNTDPVTNGRVLDRDWHRIALGVPVRIEAGRHFLALGFMNDFAAEGSDRNLEIDRFELLKLDAVDPAGGVPALAGAARAPGMSGAGMMRQGPAEAERAPWRRHDGLRIALDAPLDGLPVPGRLEVRASCWWADPALPRKPRVTLRVNGVAVSQQRSANPVFWVDPGTFRAGANDVQVCAVLDSGESAATPVQAVTLDPRARTGGPRGFHRFTLHDEAWDPQLASLHVQEGAAGELEAIVLRSPGAATLSLPDELAGAYDVHLELRGDEYQGAPIASVVLEAGGESHALADLAAPADWSTMHAATADLPRGSKRLVIAFRDDLDGPEGVGRSLWLQAVVLHGASAAPDGEAPEVRLVWPPDGHRVHGADVVVAEAFDAGTLAGAELIVDGQETGMRIDAPGQAGRLAFPLLLRGLSPGRHTVAVRAGDEAGNSGESAAIALEVSAYPLPEPGPHARAVHLLRRFGYGADPREIAAVLLEGELPWLEARLLPPAMDPGDRSVRERGRVLYPEDGDYGHVPGRLLQHAMETPNPVRARLLAWVENHFSTWMRKTGPDLEWPEHEAFAELGPAPFARLLLASATSPCMLIYLDQQYSFAHALNENYAREIMELHTVGVHGGYVQADVTALARLLTGWTVSDEGDGRSAAYAFRRTFRFDPQLNAGEPERWFGLAFGRTAPSRRHDRARHAIEHLASHPGTALFVSRKLAEHYVGLPAPEGLVADLARVFLETDGDLRALLRAIARHPAFWASMRSPRLEAPFGWAVRIARAGGAPLHFEAYEFLARCGTAVLDRPTPDGFPEEDGAYADTNAVLQRWRFARLAEPYLVQTIPWTWRTAETPMTPEWRQRIVDAVAQRLVGGPLGEASNRAALDVVGRASGTPEEVAAQAAVMVALLPEAHLR